MMNSTIRLLGLAVAVLAQSGRLEAQRSVGSARARPIANVASGGESLDRWLVSRYRGVQLLPDSGSALPLVPMDAPYPRVESVRGSAAADTLYALHFGVQAGRSQLGVGVTVRLSGPSGTISQIGGRIVARRGFRVASRPNVLAAGEGWRYGWAYLVVTTRGGKAAPVTGFRNWLVVDAGEPERGR